MSLKSNLILVPVVWNFIILVVYGGFPIVGFVTLFSALLGVAIGLAIAAGVRVLGSGISDESVHLAFIVGTLSGFYGLMTLGVLFGQGSGSVSLQQLQNSGWRGYMPWGWQDLMNNQTQTQNPSYVSSVGGGQTYITNFPYGTIIQSIMGMIFLLGIILWSTRSD